MGDSTKNSIDLLMRQFDKMKKEYIEVKAANEKLEDGIDLLRQRLQECESQKQKLVDIIKEVTSSSKLKESRMAQLLADNDNVMAENVHLKCLVQAKDVKILDLEDTITKLNGQILLLKLEKGTKNNAKRPRTALKVIKKNENSNVSFDHPSFNDGVKSSVKKITKKTNQRCRNVKMHFNATKTPCTWISVEELESQPRKLSRLFAEDLAMQRVPAVGVVDLQVTICVICYVGGPKWLFITGSVDLIH
ncbi:hypothetical protein QAD02_000301 [Eretmocerus hayati]|uniref:Uncharacterized protein n=1 Tax=Eretmocerus hayati TaxID=131215 RepID=A0ACC2NFM0_9HYME|nr:hypothetical protein QAD02_000301 [Eretmocerus hayati]